MARPKGFALRACSFATQTVAFFVSRVSAKANRREIDYRGSNPVLLFVKKEIHQMVNFFLWPARRDSNPRSPESESVALSNCATDGNPYYYIINFSFFQEKKLLGGFIPFTELLFILQTRRLQITPDL